ncbi:MAG: hypothetical protein FJ125_18510 [Deltaproteobacteria bacterium]|nr:hypothetical protein [Deltaproteobacteria bacterium]
MTSTQALPAATATTPEPRPTAQQRTCRGRVVRFSYQGVQVQLEGEPRPRTLQLSVSLFPLAHWKKLDGNQIHNGRPVVAYLLDSEVQRIIPG